ncbi:(deoxy)nucleoside triphosphate pyrophosphohydrolase [Rhodococcus sp. MS16]|uniref:8-oxo-dGTP diphosphatase n=1 Tax=Nocardia globerula TaxID=1818 RepID=A0A652YSC5_NOCGL|nr:MULTISPECIES: (deoxy)nucleoside triphosphate pyrophosphohydrolase [Rhodococcus]MDV8068941.1 (deoxy)nucleoside triphosphate pyrophosphohydrolase [Rhodococcus sp. IEGM 1366]NMD61546.1 (deoxy)nucleoside triphosphate pyrophosphohydrolase [Nocardia globerula]NRI69019.1 (deoxy)nucleoside triphosphate pyrophosphohydrolase [Rhodococcus sp. MS16]PVX66902.1 8-oxo-dGTP diphosphatase [Rhodococcus globerulus]
MSDEAARGGGAPDEYEIVAGAIFRDGRLLLAQRIRPPELAGMWELPGGKVEAFETPQHALERELAEELGVVVRCGRRIGVDVALGRGRVLRAYRVDILAGEPAALDHAQLAWVDADDLEKFDMVVNDQAWIPDLLTELRRLRLPEPS